MTPDVSASALFPATLTMVRVLAGLASLVSALELLWLMHAGSIAGVWRPGALATEWGVLRAALGRRAFTLILLVQCLAAVALIASAAAESAALLAMTTYLAAVRFRGNVNGGSDAMLFTVLGGLTLALSDAVPLLWREAGLLYVAAQLTFSYLRAGIVKARQRSWWSGDALGAFVALPAYGVPAGRWMTRSTLQAMSIGVILFECAFPLSFAHPAVCALFLGMAFVFHATTAMLFGLNRFFLVWSAALPTLWYAVHRAM